MPAARLKNLNAYRSRRSFAAMSSPSPIGLLTCIRVKDIPEALGLGRSAGLHSPGLSRAVVIEGEIPENAHRALSSAFEHIIPMRPEHFKLGWQSKNVVHHYSPFERSLFMDADCFVLKDLRPFFELMAGRPVGFVTKSIPEQETGAALYAGVSLDKLLTHFQVDWWPQILGGGHFYFERGEVSRRIFERAYRGYGAVEQVRAFGWKSGTVPDELSLQLALVEAGMARSCSVCDYPLMAWSPAISGNPDVITGKLYGRLSNGSLFFSEDYLAVHFGGDHHNIKYRRECYRLALSQGAFAPLAALRPVIGAAAYLNIRNGRARDRLRRLLGQ